MAWPVTDVQHAPLDQLGIDPSDPAFYLRPDFHALMTRLRTESPLYEFAPGQRVVTRHADVRTVSRDPEAFCSGRGVLVNDPLRTAALGSTPPTLIHMDPPVHGDHRGLVNRRFGPRSLRQIEDRVRALAREVFDEVPAGEPIDFVDRLSAPFPLLVIADLLGIDQTDRRGFRRWSDSTIESPDRPAGETMAALGELTTFLKSLMQRARDRVAAGHEDDDLVSLLVTSSIDGEPLSDNDVFGHLITLLVAGNETTRTLLSAGAVVLAEYPDQRAALAAEPARLPDAVEECLRWTSPVRTFCRTATTDVEVGGAEVAAGDYLILLYASANRDELAFGPTADRFDVTRPRSAPQMAFGFGEHVCLGAGLARMEAWVFFDELLSRFPNYEIAGPAVPVASTIVAGVSELPVVLRA